MCHRLLFVIVVFFVCLFVCLFLFLFSLLRYVGNHKPSSEDLSPFLEGGCVLQGAYAAHNNILM